MGTQGTAQNCVAALPSTGWESATLQALHRGEEDAFWQLWEHYRAPLQALCLRWMNGNFADAEDALNEVMVRARQRLPQCAHKVSQPGPWLMRLAHNLCVDLQRETHRHHRLLRQLEQVRDSASPGDELRPDAPDPAGEREANQKNLWRVERLPADLRQAFVLYFFEEHSCEEISQLLNLSLSSVHKRLQKARAALRRDWEKPAEPEGGQASATPAGAAPPGPGSRRWEVPPPGLHPRLVAVQLPCRLKRYFPLFLSRRPVRELQKIRALEARLAHHPTARGWSELAELLYQTGTWEEALQACRQALQLHPGWIRGYCLLGEIYSLTGRWDEAGVVYEQALPKARQPATRQHLLGLLESSRQNWPAAQEALTQAAGLQPANPAHGLALARSFLGAGAPQRCLEQLEKVWRLTLRPGAALNLSCQALRHLPQSRETIRRLEKLLLLQPANVCAAMQLAASLVQSTSPDARDASQLRRLLRRLLRQAPDSPSVIALLAQFHLLQAEPRRGIDLMARLWEQFPQCPRIAVDYRQLLDRAHTQTAGLATLPATPPPTTACAPACARCAGL